MGFRTDVPPGDNDGTRPMAINYLREASSLAGKLRAQLPKNRDLLKKIHDYGMQPI